MQIVTTTKELARICKAFAASPYVTVDTEFLREVTFWPELCLIQMAAPDEAVIIDPLASGIDLKPFFELMADRNVVKVAVEPDHPDYAKLMGVPPKSTGGGTSGAPAQPAAPAYQAAPVQRAPVTGKPSWAQ